MSYIANKLRKYAALGLIIAGKFFLAFLIIYDEFSVRYIYDGQIAVEQEIEFNLLYLIGRIALAIFIVNKELRWLISRLHPD